MITERQTETVLLMKFEILGLEVRMYWPSAPRCLHPDQEPNIFLCHQVLLSELIQVRFLNINTWRVVTKKIVKKLNYVRFPWNLGTQKYRYTPIYMANFTWDASMWPTWRLSVISQISIHDGWRFRTSDYHDFSHFQRSWRCFWKRTAIL